MALWLHFSCLQLLFVSLLFGVYVFPGFAIGGDEETAISRIAFGSCANQSAPQPIWDGIINFKPQLFIWMGDNIYGDNKRPFKLIGKERTVGPWKNVPRFYPASEQELVSRYNKAKTNPGYSLLRERTRVLLLDTRYHRDPLFSDGEMLGTSQWAWLEKEMHRVASQITIIVSSIQVISNFSATTEPLFHVESWAHFPKERDRLFKLIVNSNRNGVFFISGDVHFGEITRYDCGNRYPLYDITSSGLTQAVEKAVPSPLAFLIRVAAWLSPSTMRVFNKECRYRSCVYGKPNFGTIEMDWDANPVSIKFSVRDMNGEPVTSVNVSLSELQAGNMHDSGTPSVAIRGQKHCLLEVDLPWIIRHRLAIFFFGTLTVLVLAMVLMTVAALSVANFCIHKFKLD
ncbi:uncharacterized protein LOC18439636 isoform X2 [Amborella trichopoda]|uniref:uncharacterized protein LOC18439636 isoform X2 n=1 Tax=Amborella trichopoda TaxID=13333 RepID=UPI0009C00494|nr:uncharacterized protein LOC18439636 isoform X2 [Amborella trichopoda]|eukprot:XP_020526400.1 uncharacterized protein LOC18439636 isoform X2 [Amborella trichopoda]